MAAALERKRLRREAEECDEIAEETFSNCQRGILI
jgi:hypothetical protein